MLLLIWDSKQLNSYFSDEDTEAESKKIAQIHTASESQSLPLNLDFLPLNLCQLHYTSVAKDVFFPQIRHSLSLPKINLVTATKVIYSKLIKVLIHPFISYLGSICYVPAVVLGLRMP